MEIKLRCSCGQVLKVSEEAAGKTGKCPACGSPIRIPSLEEIAEAQQASAQASADAEEEAPVKKKGTGSFKAPTRSKTRSKALAGARPDKEEKKKSTRSLKTDSKRDKKTRSKTRSKTKAKGRKKTSVISKYRGKDEDDEGGYAPQKKSPVKILIIIGIVVVGGLIGLYAFKWGPEGKAKKRTHNYVVLMQQFVNMTRETFVEKYEKMIPASLSDYNRRVDDVADAADRVRGATSRRMQEAYTSDNYMEDTLKILKDARGIIEQRMKTDADNQMTEDKLDDFKESFTAKINVINNKVADIEKLLDTIRPQIGMKQVAVDEMAR